MIKYVTIRLLLFQLLSSLLSLLLLLLLSALLVIRKTKNCKYILDFINPVTIKTFVNNLCELFWIRISVLIVCIGDSGVIICVANKMK